MTILAILTKFCLKFANLVNFAMSFFALHFLHFLHFPLHSANSANSAVHFFLSFIVSDGIRLLFYTPREGRIVSY